jgi:hypothetical protein
MPVMSDQMDSRGTLEVPKTVESLQKRTTSNQRIVIAIFIEKRHQQP